MFGMKSIATMFIFALTAMAAGAMNARAQGPTRGPVEPHRDETMEIAAKHNLEVARWYLTKRKAYEGARDRLQEILDTYPDFSRMDEVVFLMGETYLKLGKKDKAAEFYDKVVKSFPDSEHVKKARERLEELK